MHCKHLTSSVSVGILVQPVEPGAGMVEDVPGYTAVRAAYDPVASID